VLIESEKVNSTDVDIAVQLGIVGSATQTEHGAVIETVSPDDMEQNSPEAEKKKVAYILSLASLLDSLKLNDAAKLVRQGLEQARKTGGTIQISNQKLSAYISQFVKSSFRKSDYTNRGVSGRMLLSFGGEVEH
jgi:hypothetical protein